MRLGIGGRAVMEGGLSIQGDFRSTVDEPGGERRSEGRIATVFRPILIETEQFAGFCLLRNLSPNGMRGQVYTSFGEGLPITVQFGPDQIVQGTVIWCKDEYVGVRFDEPVDVERVLSDLGRKLVEGKLNRAPRLQIECDAELVFGDRTLAIEVQDVSQRGIKAVASFIVPGDEVWVRLNGLERKAVVRWTQGRTAGLNFVVPLSFEELAHWVIRQQTTVGWQQATGHSPSSQPSRRARAA